MTTEPSRSRNQLYNLILSREYSNLGRYCRKKELLMSDLSTTLDSELIEAEAAEETVLLDRLPQAAAIGAILAFIGNFIILNVGRAFGAGFEVIMPGTAALQPLPVWPTLIMVCIGAAAAGAVALMLLANNEGVAKPVTVFGIVALVVFLLSIYYGPSDAVTDSTSTVSGLRIMHAWTALAVTGALVSTASGESA